jgi:hypothetical protein
MTPERDPFNLDSLRINLADPTLVPAKPAKSRKQGKRERICGEFYQVPLAWADKAAEAAGGYLILALRIHRAWRMREEGTSVIAVTARVLAGPSGNSRGNKRIIRRLEVAGLVEVVERKPGCAVRIRVIDDDLG